MAVNTPLADSRAGFLDALLAGRSALTRWTGFDASRIYSKIGGDLSGYDVSAKVAALEGVVPADMHRRLRKLAARAPWSTRLSMLMAAEAYADAGLFGAAIDPWRVAVVVAGHNINSGYHRDNLLQFEAEPDFVEALYSVHGLDTDHAGCVSEVLGTRGPLYTVGGACSSGNTALRAAVDEIRHHDVDVALVVGAVFDFNALDLHAMALMGAISVTSFNESPRRASRPFDVRREGFVPAHGGAVLVLEALDHARRREARVDAEVLAVEANADGSHLPQPSEESQTRLMEAVLRRAGLEPDAVDYVSAHATSTPLGDLTEIRSLKRVFAGHAPRLRVNATKSMLGHTLWAAPVVETVAAILQMQAGRLHPTINVEELDPEIDLDVCAGRAVSHPVRVLMKNSFGFGGINCVSVLRSAG